MKFREWLLEESVMPFGKHKGEELSNIDEDYLKYILNNFDLRPKLKTAVEEELAKREAKDVFYLGKAIVPFSYETSSRGYRSYKIKFEKGELLSFKKYKSDNWFIDKLEPTSGTTTQQESGYFTTEELKDKIESIRGEDGKLISSKNINDLYHKHAKPKYSEEEHGEELNHYVKKIHNYINEFSQKNNVDKKQVMDWIKERYKTINWTGSVGGVENIIISNYNGSSDNPWSGHGFSGKTENLFKELKKFLENKLTEGERRAAYQEKERKREESWVKRGMKRCTRCGGAGGFKHWPGFTCFDCEGEGAVYMNNDEIPDNI